MIIFAICFLFFIGTLFFLQRRLISLIVGILLIGNGINLAIFFASKPQMGGFSFLSMNGSEPPIINDPVPQALVLTAIVIGFAMLSFMIAIVKKLIMQHQSWEISDLLEEDPD